MTNPINPVTVEQRHTLSHYEQMLDAQSQCVPCRLCGGKARITDAGPGSGYYIACENGSTYRESEGCLINERRLGGWAYNVMEWWNRLHSLERDHLAAPDVRMVEALHYCAEAPFSGWTIAQAMARQALAALTPAEADGISAATKRMAKTLGAEFKRHEPPTPTSELLPEDVERLREKIDFLVQAKALAEERLRLQGPVALDGVAHDVQRAYKQAFDLLPSIRLALSRRPTPSAPDRREVEALREAIRDIVPTAAAMLSILQRAHAQKKQPKSVVASDTMFATMMIDYQKSLARTRAALASLTPSTDQGVPDGVWSKPEYAAADRARNEALKRDPNDQMGALAAAVDAALSTDLSPATTINMPSVDQVCDHVAGQLSATPPQPDQAELVEIVADRIQARMGPLFGSPEYLADPVKRARSETRQREKAESDAQFAVEVVLAALSAPVPAPSEGKRK